jgi:hypothetical protein
MTMMTMKHLAIIVGDGTGDVGVDEYEDDVGRVR